MRISDVTIEDLLKKSGHLTDEQLKKLREEQRENRRPLQDLVVRHELISDKELTKLYADYASIPYIELDPSKIPSETLSLIPERIARQYNAVVFKQEDGVKYLAMEDPDDIQAVDFIQKQLGTNLKIYLATKENILHALDNYRGDANKELSDIIKVNKEEDAEHPDQISEADISEDSPIAQTVNLLLEYAVRANASDVHIEPREEFIQIRYRVDGVLKEVNRLPKDAAGALISRIKILSSLKIDERRTPQDGRFKITLAGHTYALRVSTLPVADGEKVVMRILDEGNKALSLQDLGYWGRTLQATKEVIQEPHGMILVTGPTGSGKSTSLFSILTILNSPEVNISTVEDPVEYKIPGINQTQVNPKAGMTFASGLRALLRQDPDIVMVGEVRDVETADLSVQAALTGHLVFTTLHTNNAATSLPRLLDMGIEPFLIASTVRATIGQRLVRRLCTKCRISFTPSPNEIEKVFHAFNMTNQMLERINALEVAALKEGIGKSIGDALGSTPTGITKLWRASEKGCDNCNSSGYKGRLGIYEVLPNTPEIQKLIVSNATSNMIQSQAIKEGMDTMQVDGLVKSLRGETSIEEILRVTRE